VIALRGTLSTNKPGPNVVRNAPRYYGAISHVTVRSQALLNPSPVSITKSSCGWRQQSLIGQSMRCLCHVRELGPTHAIRISPSYSRNIHYLCGEGPRSRRYGRTAAMRLLVQPCDEDEGKMISFFSLFPSN
jgi:hypothetical protein